MIYTGPIDAFFDYRYGKLPYRSLEFRHVRPCPRSSSRRSARSTIPNDHAYTRISEFKHITGQTARQGHRSCTNTRGPRAIPYYPVPRPENAALYKKYEALRRAATEDVHFVGRLATYKYYNMDQVVGQALAAFKRLKLRHQKVSVDKPYCLTSQANIPGIGIP